MTNLNVKVRVVEDNTREVIDDLRDAVEDGLAAAVPGIVALAARNVRGYSTRVADSLTSHRIAPATWLIRAEHHASHIVESGGRHVAAHPFLVPALMQSRTAVARAITGRS